MFEVLKYSTNVIENWFGDLEFVKNFLNFVKYKHYSKGFSLNFEKINENKYKITLENKDKEGNVVSKFYEFELNEYNGFHDNLELNKFMQIIKNNRYITRYEPFRKYVVKLSESDLDVYIYCNLDDEEKPIKGYCIKSFYRNEQDKFILQKIDENWNVSYAFDKYELNEMKSISFSEEIYDRYFRYLIYHVYDLIFSKDNLGSSYRILKERMKSYIDYTLEELDSKTKNTIKRWETMESRIFDIISKGIVKYKNEIVEHIIKNVPPNMSIYYEKNDEDEELIYIGVYSDYLDKLCKICEDEELSERKKYIWDILEKRMEILEKVLKESYYRYGISILNNYYDFYILCRTPVESIIYVDEIDVKEEILHFMSEEKIKFYLNNGINEFLEKYKNELLEIFKKHVKLAPKIEDLINETRDFIDESVKQLLKEFSMI